MDLCTDNLSLRLPQIPLHQHDGLFRQLLNSSYNMLRKADLLIDNVYNALYGYHLWFDHDGGEFDSYTWISERDWTNKIVGTYSSVGCAGCVR